MAINAEILTDILEMENIRVDHAENGRIAVTMFAESPVGDYAAILMDVRMPEMDGLEATATIRRMKREDAGRIPIIALTANAFDEDVQRSMQAGMDAHLSKPVDIDQLKELLGVSSSEDKPAVAELLQDIRRETESLRFKPLEGFVGDDDGLPVDDGFMKRRDMLQSTMLSEVPDFRIKCNCLMSFSDSLSSA